MLGGRDHQRGAQLILEADEGDTICARGTRGNGHLVVEHLNKGFRDGLVGAGITDMHFQGDSYSGDKNRLCEWGTTSVGGATWEGGEAEGIGMSC